MNNGKYRVATNITEYHIISKLNFRRTIIPKFMTIRQLIFVRKYMSKINMFKMDVSTLSTP